MAEVLLQIGEHINGSLQNGDTIYYCPTSEVSGDNVQLDQSEIREFGTLISVVGEGIRVYVPGNVNSPEFGDYIFFSKPSEANTSSIKGYYAEVEMKNNSTDHATLFSFGIGTEASSK